MSTEQNEQIARTWVDAMNTGDAGTVEGLLSEDVTWYLHGDLPTSGYYKGRKAVIEEFLSAGLSLYAPGSLHFDVTNLVAQGSHVVIELHALGRSARGGEYDNRYCMALELADGKITAVREYTDSHYSNRVLFG